MLLAKLDMVRHRVVTDVTINVGDSSLNMQIDGKSAYYCQVTGNLQYADKKYKAVNFENVPVSVVELDDEKGEARFTNIDHLINEGYVEVSPELYKVFTTLQIKRNQYGMGTLAPAPTKLEQTVSRYAYSPVRWNGAYTVSLNVKFNPLEKQPCLH